VQNKAQNSRLSRIFAIPAPSIDTQYQAQLEVKMIIHSIAEGNRDST
jgi:hypothetical protein